MLRCDGVSAGYHGKPVLRNIDIEVQPGEVVGLLGPNGGGKSTLLRTIAGLVPLLEGEVFVEGERIRTMPVKRLAQRVSFVPQDEPWPFAFTAEEIVAMGRLPSSNAMFDTEEDHAIARAAMESAGCIDLAARVANELSGGERQRVLIARALAQQTPIMLLDEPTAHLDPAFQMSTARLVRELAARGKAVLVAIHDLSTASAMADAVALVFGGGMTNKMPPQTAFSSGLLEKAFGMAFETLTTADGRLLAFPRAT